MIFSCLCVQQCLAFNLSSSVFCVHFIFLKAAMSIVATPVTFNDVSTSCLRFFEICFEFGCRRQCDGTVTVCCLPSLMGELKGNSREQLRICGLAWEPRICLRVDDKPGDHKKSVSLFFSAESVLFARECNSNCLNFPFFLGGISFICS